MDDDTALAAPVSRRREATRQRLLDAAAQVFAETGLDAASVEAICERAGYTRGAFYSNFDSKEELFLALCLRMAHAQVAAVRERVAAFGADDSSHDPALLVRQVLEVAGDDRMGVLLLGEIRLHALRTPALAEAFLAQDEELIASVALIVTDVARAKRMTLRTSPEAAARILLDTWTTTSERAVMRGLDETAMRERLGAALAEAAGVLLGD